MMYSLEFDTLEELIEAMSVVEESKDGIEGYPEYTLEYGMSIADEGYYLEVEVYDEGE